jgi:endonuclease/exonuclease/phosphatase family metal-dependent hydrolase
MDVRYGATGHFPVAEPEDGRVVGTSLWGNAILSRLPIVASDAVALPIAADDDLVEPAGAIDPVGRTPEPLAGVRYADAPTGARESRTLVRATVRASGGHVHVLATHLTHVGSGQRRLQADAIAAEIARLDGRVVLAGDLNATIDAPALEPLRTGLRDAFDAVGVAADDRRRVSLRRGSVAIDHILARDLRPTDCRVARDAGDLSDHWPLVARFAV